MVFDYKTAIGYHLFLTRILIFTLTPWSGTDAGHEYYMPQTPRREKTAQFVKYFTLGESKKQTHRRSSFFLSPETQI